MALVIGVATVVGDESECIVLGKKGRVLVHELCGIVLVLEAYV